MTNYRRKKNKPKEIGKQYNINNYIQADEVRILDEEGSMVGVFSRQEALVMANEQGMDLVEINPKANPPVVKIIEFSKFKYRQDKADKAKPKGGNDMKTLRVSVRISNHDLTVQAKKADEFLSKGIKVKLQVQMKGREKAHPEVARETMQNFLELITGNYIMESEPKQLGDSCFTFLKPKK